MAGGCIYKEWQNNLGRGVCSAGRIRWVAEITVRRKRYRFRSVNYVNVKAWLDRFNLKMEDRNL